nr:putative beta-glucosidase btge [Quercus suber]
MTYTPYANDGSCKSAGQVSSDIGSIAAKGFTTVRIYATDCSGPENVGAAIKAHGMKLIIGIYIDGEGIGAKTSEQVSELTQWGSSNWDIVEMVVVGNEAIFNGYCSASELASFISEVKSEFSSAGYSGPVTTTEPLGTIQANKATICPAVDVIAANIHPFFNTAILASGAGPFVASSLSDLADACNGEKEAYNLETGWPSSGKANGKAVPGMDFQKTAIESIMQHAGSKSAIFSFQNDEWKAPGDLDVEQFWGCADLFSG